MGKVRIDIALNAQTGKSEEVEVLTLITGYMAGTQTYLESLLSPTLLSWFTSQVRDDFPPNIIEAYYAQQRENSQMVSAYRKIEEENERLKEDLERLRNDYKNELIGKNNIIDAQKANVSALQSTINKERYEHGIAMQERDKLAEQVTKLKVMLFDLQNTDK